MNMFISYEKKEEWPALAWLAKCKAGSDEIRVFAGEGVEAARDWCCEAVWDGGYADGAFDLTDIVAGTGIRLRDGVVAFVSSGSTVDRLVVVTIGDATFVSNSLCCLLSHLDSKPLVTYPNYHRDFHSIVSGLKQYRRQIPSACGNVTLVYFDNLSWDGRSLSITEKPNKDRQFGSFADYYDFLVGSMARISANASNSARMHPFSIVSTLSSGYDSATVAALARKAGCARAISFVDSRSGDGDSGEDVARQLGIELTLFSRNDYKRFPESEAFIYSGEGEGEESFLGALTGELSRKVLLTGFHGDKVWEKNTKLLSDEIVRGDATGLSLTEWRLREQFIHCPVPFWSCRSIKSIEKISRSEEMAPWDLRNDYNRPICRRILEQEGVPREAFGIKKRATARTFYESAEVLTPENSKSYGDWIRKHRTVWIRQGEIPPTMALDRAAYLFYTGRAKSMRFLMRLAGNLPVLWRAQNWLRSLHRKYIIENAPPSKYKRHIVNWAIEKVVMHYR